MFPTGKGTQLLTNDDGSAKEMYLFTHYWQLTCDQVSASYRYYALNVRYPITSTVNGATITTKGTFHNELKWTYSYFRNNVEPRLYELVQREFVTFEPLAGPLFFKLLLDHLVLSNDTNEAALVNTVLGYSIKDNHKTEDICEVTQLLSSITETVAAIQNHKENPLSDDYLQYITTILQTISVPKFNRDFAQL